MNIINKEGAPNMVFYKILTCFNHKIAPKRGCGQNFGALRAPFSFSTPPFPKSWIRPCNGRIVQSAGSIQDANFGIKEDGTIMIGYISDDEVFNATNPFRFLLTGVIWLVRSGTNNVNKSMYVECSRNSRGISMNNFVRITSARAAIGHDDRGRVVLAHVEGKSLVRG